MKGNVVVDPQGQRHRLEVDILTKWINKGMAPKETAVHEWFSFDGAVYMERRTTASEFAPIQESHPVSWGSINKDHDPNKKLKAYSIDLGFHFSAIFLAASSIEIAWGNHLATIYRGEI